MYANQTSACSLAEAPNIDAGPAPAEFEVLPHAVDVRVAASSARADAGRGLPVYFATGAPMLDRSIQVPPVSADTESAEARLVTLEQQTEWLRVELERVRAVLLSASALTNRELLDDD